MSVLFLPGGGWLLARPDRDWPPPRPVLRPFDIDDPRFCNLSPAPFLCRSCLASGKQFAERIEWQGEEQRPLRSYLCLDWQALYLGSAGSTRPSDR
ncbi:MAG: hypothetical protein K1X75_03560 [Leptospirales bacterium]|nr:hypothetical protein [Leptospirales bacterium]